MLQKTQPKMIFVDSRFEQRVISALQALDMTSEIIVMETTFKDHFSSESSEKYDEDIEVVDVDVENQIAVLVCTSGTTGFVKGVPLTHRSFFVSIADTL